MPKRSQLKPHKDANRRTPWRVDLAARYSPSGKRERYFFETKAQAENYAEVQRIRLANYGVQGAGILPPSQQERPPTRSPRSNPIKFRWTQSLRTGFHGGRPRRPQLATRWLWTGS